MPQNKKKRIPEIIKILIFGILSYLAVWAVGVNKHVNSTIFNNRSILYIPALLAVFFIANKAFKIKEKRIIIFALISAITITLIEVTGFFLEQYGAFLSITYSRSDIATFFIIFIGYSFLFYCFLAFLYSNVSTKAFTSENEIALNKKRLYFFGSWIIIFLCWLPYYIVCFPGVITHDSVDQISQVIGLYSINNHHPVMHSMLIAIFMKIGQLFGSLNAGVALYSIFQMLAMSAIFAYSLSVMAKFNVHKNIRIIILIYYALFTVFPFYSISMWKDVPFSCLLLLFTIFLFEILFSEKDYFKSKKHIIAFTLTLLGVMVFRNNGFHVMIISMPFICFFVKQYRKPLTIITAVCLILFIFYKTFIFSYYHINDAPVREALSVPIQQLVSAMIKHEDEISADDKELINNLFNMQYNEDFGFEDIYNPRISDPAKAVFNEEFYKENKADILKTWVKLFFRFPADYIEAFALISYGYYYPEIQYWVVAGFIPENNLNIYQTQPFPNLQHILVNLTSTSLYNMPIISMLYSLGFAFMVMCFLAVILCLKRQYKFLLASLSIFILWLTCLASPVHGEFRYAFGMFTCLPLILAITLRLEPKEKAVKES